MQIISPAVTGDSLVEPDPANSAHIGWLDGVRGLAAFWVLAFHAQLFTGMQEIPILSYGSVPVDLFMMLSGFLITYNYSIRRASESWEKPRSWIRFWIKRLFRIAPVYYLLLVFAFVLSPFFMELRKDIIQHWSAADTSVLRYTDHSLKNILAHITFLFGVLPDYSFKTPLPDWSIALEMEFYAVFPFLMLLVSRIGGIASAIVTFIASVILGVVFKDYFNQFEMPTLLPMKIYMFWAGILLALGHHRGALKAPLLVAVSGGLVYWAKERDLQALFRVVMIIGFFYLSDIGYLPGSKMVQSYIETLRRLLGGRVARFLGDTSYGVYLLHQLILVPVAGWLVSWTRYIDCPGTVRFAICLLITAPAVYCGAWLLHIGIEKPGIRFGKFVLKNKLSPT